MGGVYGTYLANADKGQWHVVTLVWSFKLWKKALWNRVEQELHHSDWSDAKGEEEKTHFS